MKILHVIRGLANSSGTTHIVGPLAEAQARLGHEVSIYFVDKPPFAPVTPSAELVETRCFPATVLRRHPGVSLAFARAIDENLAHFDIAHIHAVWNFPSFYAMRAAARTQLPFVVSPQGSLEPWALASGSLIRRAYVARVEGPLIRSAALMQALSQEEGRQFKAFGYHGPISIIPNGVHEDWLALERGSLARDLELAPGARTLLFLSRVHPKKGLDRLIQGFARFSVRASNVTLVIAGHDAGSGYLTEMRRLADELGVAHLCRFIGEVSGEAKRRVLAGADAFALSSHSEGLPVAALEAMAAGLPVLITPGCNLPEVAERQAGVVVRPEADEVATGLRTLFANAEELAHYGARGRQLVAEHFTWPLIARQTIAAYERAVRRDKKSAAA